MSILPETVSHSLPGALWAKFNKFLDDTALVLFILLLSVATLQVISRYVLEAPLPWTEELARFLMVWVTFLGAASVTRRKLHITVEFLSAKFPPFAGHLINAATYILILFFLTVVFWGTIVMFRSSWPMYAGTIVWLRISWVYLGAVLGTGLMLLYAFIHLYHEITRLCSLSPSGKE